MDLTWRTGKQRAEEGLAAGQCSLPQQMVSRHQYSRTKQAIRHHRRPVKKIIRHQPPGLMNLYPQSRSLQMEQGNLTGRTVLRQTIPVPRRLQIKLQPDTPAQTVSHPQRPAQGIRRQSPRNHRRELFLPNRQRSRQQRKSHRPVPEKTATPVGILREIWMIFYNKQYDKKINQIRQLYDILRSWSCLFIL